MKAPILSNQLADLAERVKISETASLKAERSSVEHAIASGCLLNEAKRAAQHGEWLPFLDRSGISERRAQRLMHVAGSGMNAEVVSRLGGIAPATAFLREWAVNQPSPDQALFVSRLLATEEDEVSPVAYVWEAEDRAGHYNAATIADDKVIVSRSSMPMAVTIDDDQPIPVILHWLTTHMPVPIGEWRLSRAPRGLIDALGLQQTGAA